MFERCFVFEIFIKGVAKYGSVKAFAQQVWPEKDEKNAAQKLYDIFGVSNKTGRPQKLRLDEAVCLVQLADGKLTFAQFCFEISEKVRLGWVEPSKEERLKAIKEVSAKTSASPHGATRRSAIPLAIQ